MIKGLFPLKMLALCLGANVCEKNKYTSSLITLGSNIHRNIFQDLMLDRIVLTFRERWSTCFLGYFNLNIFKSEYTNIIPVHIKCKKNRKPENLTDILVVLIVPGVFLSPLIHIKHLRLAYLWENIRNKIFDAK